MRVVENLPIFAHSVVAVLNGFVQSALVVDKVHVLSMVFQEEEL